MELTAFGARGLRFSREHFSEDTIEWLLRSPKEPLLQAPLAETAEVERTPESAFGEAWAELASDPEFAAAVGKGGYSVERGQADFMRALATPLAPDIDQRLGVTLKTTFEAKLEDDAFVHRLNGEPILAIPTAMDSAARVSANAEAVTYGLFLVVDVLSIVAAAASVKIFVPKERLARSMQGPLRGFLQRLLNPAAVRELKRLQEAEKTIELIRRVLGLLRGSTNLKAVVGTFFSSFNWLDKAVAVVQLLASILLLFGTAGASFAARIVALAGAILMLFADVVGLARAMQAK